MRTGIYTGVNILWTCLVKMFISFGSKQNSALNFVMFQIQYQDGYMTMFCLLVCLLVC